MNTRTLNPFAVIRHISSPCIHHRPSRETQPAGRRPRTGLLLLAALFLLAPAARAGLTFHLQVSLETGGYYGNGYYYAYPSLSTNATTPAAPLGGYAVSSPGSDFTTHFLLTGAGSSSLGASANGFADFDSFMDAITNGDWMIVVTNATSTNYYNFTVSESGLASNAMPHIVVTYPLTGAVNVPNQPTFTWGGASGLSGSLFVEAYNNDFSYDEYASVPTSQTSWPAPTVMPNGPMNFDVSAYNDASSAIVATTPLDTVTAAPISGWASTASASDYGDTYFTVTNTASPANLVVNGGFETGDFTGWTTDSGSVSTGLTAAHSGTYGAEFGPVGSLGYLSQTLSTTAGTNYVLSFWLDSPDGETPNQFQVSWGGTTLLNETNLPAIGWTNIQFTVSATSSSTLLQFGFRDDPAFLYLDEVSVVPTGLSATNLSPPFTWTTNAGEITITGYTGSGGAVNIPDTINGHPVTSIADYAFEYVNSITSVAFGANVTSIGQSAFFNCGGLTSVTIPDGVVGIGTGAFDYCYNLSGVTLPASVISLGNPVFDGCSSLTAITVDPANSDYSSTNGVLFDKAGTTLLEYPGGLGGNYTIPGGVTGIGDFAFDSCYSLTGVTIPDGVTSIGVDAFNYCSDLPDVTVPASVTSIGYKAFANCGSLTAITVDGANSDYSSMAGVLFNHAKTALIQYPAGLSGNYIIPDSVSSIGDAAFTDCQNLTAVAIPNGVTSIGNLAFFDCYALENVTIPDGVTSLGYDAFENCVGLTSVTIPNHVPALQQYAFYGCTSLTNATIGSGVTFIANGVFGYCTNLTGVYFQGNSPTPNNDASVFSGDTPGTVRYLPGTTGWVSTFDGWPTAQWFQPNPVILDNNGGSIGVQSGGFGFTISWATNTSVVVDVATNLTNPVWIPVSTNVISGGTFSFTDALWTNSPGRYYRVHSQ